MNAVAVCDYCKKRFELTDKHIAIDFINEHPLIRFRVTIECPNCSNCEGANTRTFDDFAQKVEISNPGQLSLFE